MMPREVLKPINSALLNTRRREMHKTITIDKENIVNKDASQQLSKGAIPKLFPVRGILKNKSPNHIDSNIPSSSTLSVIPSNDLTKKKHLRFKPDSTYTITQFSVYDEDTENIPDISMKTVSEENKDETLFRKSRKFFIDQERAAAQCISGVKSPVAKRVSARKSLGESFIKAKETFFVKDEAVKIRKHLDSILEQKCLDDKNNIIPKCRRIAELRGERVNLDRDSTPHDVNNIAPPHEPIKILHKNGNVDSIVRPNAPLPTYSLFEDNSSSYHKDIMNFFLKKEGARRQFNPNFRRQNTTLVQRQILIGHLMKIIKNYNYSSYIAYQAARLMDDMLDAKQIPIEQLQLVELTSMWIVMKNLLLAYVVPQASTVVSFSDGAYTVTDLLRCESDIMQTLKFEISYPDPFTVLNYSLFSHQNFIFLPKDSGFIYYSGTYMIDVALFDEQLMALSPILLGCAAAEMALILNLALHDAFTDRPINPWRTAFAKKHFKAEELLHVQQLIVRRIVQSGYRDSPEHVVYRKYKRSRYGRISQMLILKVTELIPSKSLC